MVLEYMDFVSRHDPEVGAAIRAEYQRQCDNIELIASENIVSEAVLAAMGSVLTNKYAEGYPGKRYYGGCQCVDIAENLAIERACKLFGTKFANVQPHSGAQANYAVYMALCQPGDTVLGMNLDHGGHLTHGSPVNFSGKYFKMVSYGVNEDTGVIDYDEVERIAKECKPRMIIAGASAYPRVIDFARFRAIADEVGAYLWVDMAHIAGLVAAGLHPSPVPYAHVVSTTTHKTLRGPRGGLLLTNDEELAKKLNSAIFPGSQGGPLMHVIAAKAVALGEALTPEFKTYQGQIVKNSAALAEGLVKRGMKLVSGGTDNHLSSLTCGTWMTSLARSWSAAWTRCASPPTRTRCPATPAPRSRPAACGWAALPSPAAALWRRTWTRWRSISCWPPQTMRPKRSISGPVWRN